ncbi:MAG: sulfite exporter TauE/SafE family protein [Bacteroidia bacterium]
MALPFICANCCIISGLPFGSWHYNNFHLSSNASKIYLFNKGIDKKLIIRFGIPSILAVIAGAWLSQFISSKYLELYLGFFLIAAAVLLLTVRNKTLHDIPGMLPAGGTVSGFSRTAGYRRRYPGIWRFQLFALQ